MTTAALKEYQKYRKRAIILFAWSSMYNTVIHAIINDFYTTYMLYKLKIHYI